MNLGLHLVTRAPVKYSSQTERKHKPLNGLESPESDSSVCTPCSCCVNQKSALLLSCGCIKAKQRHKDRGVAQTRQAYEGTAYTCLRNVSKGMVPNQSKLLSRTGSGMPCSPFWDSNRCSRACMFCTLCSMLSSDNMGRSALLPVCSKVHCWWRLQCPLLLSRTVPYATLAM